LPNKRTSKRGALEPDSASLEVSGVISYNQAEFNTKDKVNEELKRAYG
jgi:hypothetical protein